MTIPTKVSLIDTSDLTYSSDISVTFTNLIFDSISYATTGHIMLLGQILPNSVVVKNSQFRKLSSADITVGSTVSTNPSISTHVVFEN